MSIDDLDPATIQSLASYLLVSTEEAETLVLSAARDSLQLAREAVGDPAAPAHLRGLALLAASATGQRITAIQQHERTQYRPAFTPRDGLIPWHSRRAFGSLRPDDPPIVEERRTFWTFRTPDNPIMLEAWLKHHGCPEAFAAGPSTCYVQPAA